MTADLTDTAIAYVNGEFTALAEARVSVLDRGFLFADGVYEVVPAYGGRLFRLREHLERRSRASVGAKLKGFDLHLLDACDQVLTPLWAQQFFFEKVTEWLSARAFRSSAPDVLHTPTGSSAQP